MKKADWLILFIIAFLSLLPLALVARTEGKTVVVTAHGETVYTGPLSEDAVIEIDGGHNVVEICDGKAYMREADCADGSCLRMGAATPAQPVVCLPNEVVVTVVGEGAGPDAVAY